MRARNWICLTLLLAAAGCIQILDGDHPYGTDPKPGATVACVTASECDDKNPCTFDACTEETKTCEWVPEVDGPAPSGQTPSDCKSVVCTGGEPTVQHDDLDVPNDNNSCTEDSCNAGVPQNLPLPENSNCTVGTQTGTCLQGVCIVICTVNDPCDDGNPCTEDSCNMAANTCIFAPSDGLPTPGFVQVVGDCKLEICVKGTSTSISDDADIPVDQNKCTQDLCNGGTPSNPSTELGTSCAPNGSMICNGSGGCVECTMPSHCIGIVEDECTKRACVNNQCVPQYAGAETLASPALQTPGDCKKVVCNGMGGTTSATDNQDVPVDGNLCTKDVCTSGNPENPVEMANTVCGNGLVCNDAGTCVGCNDASQCAGMDNECQTRTCINNECGFSYKPAGMDVSVGQNDGDCKVLECDGMGKIVTSVDPSDVPVDANPCTLDVCSAQGSGSNPPSAANSPCNVNGGNVCDGSGTCKKANGLACSDGMECVSANCVDSVCCNSTCATTCRMCNMPGQLGTCVNVPSGQDDAPTCTGAAVSCDGMGTCK